MVVRLIDGIQDELFRAKLTAKWPDGSEEGILCGPYLTRANALSTAKTLARYWYRGARVEIDVQRTSIAWESVAIATAGEGDRQR